MQAVMLPIPYVHQKHLYFVGPAVCLCVCLCVVVCVYKCTLEQVPRVYRPSHCVCAVLALLRHPCWHSSGALIHIKRAPYCVQIYN